MWVYLPKQYYPSAPEPADWSEGLLSPLDTNLASSVTWNGKLQRPQSWRRVWKTASWLPRLFGATFSLSQSQISEAVLTWLQQVSPASRGRSLESRLGWPMNDGSGQQSLESFVVWQHDTSSWRMSEACLPGMEEWTPLSVDWPTRGTMQNGVCLARRKSAPPIAENDCSSWPTAQGYARGKETNNAPGYTPLDGAAKMWPMPDTQNDRDGTTMRAEASGSHAVSLHHKVAMWATPQEQDHKQNGARHSSKAVMLIQQAIAENWMTPTSRDWKDGSDPSENVPTNGLLVCQAVRSPPAPETLPPGSESSPSGPTSPRRSLNPKFVEMLMNWPVGWTSLAPLGSGSRETG